jgi:spectinomycin phosphotransferase
VSDAQRRALGAALAAIHAAELPPGVTDDAPRERFGSLWRNTARELLALAERGGPFPDEVAAEMAALMRERGGTIRELIGRAAQLAEELARRKLRFVLCHADLHAGNLLVGDDGLLRVVDWDTLIFAPPERDLMFVGAGIDGVWRAEGAQRAFYEGYGPVEPDAAALGYYRCERAVEDIAAFGEALLLSGEGGADRGQSLRYFTAAFEPGDAIPTALGT